MLPAFAYAYASGTGPDIGYVSEFGNRRRMKKEKSGNYSSDAG